MATGKVKKKAKPAPEPEELDDDLELEELDEDEVEDTAPAKKSKKAAASAPSFGIKELAALVAEKTGKTYDGRSLRTLIRKMARDESGRVTREIKQGNPSRYSWSGPKDPEVVAIVKAIADGELEAHKAEALAKLKEQKAAKAAAGEPTKKKKKKAKVEVVEEVEDDDEDFEDEEDDE